MEKKEITILVSEQDFEAMMRHLSSGRPGKPLVAVEMVRAVEGDESYNLNMFDALDEEDAKVGHDYKSVMARKTGVSVEQLDKEERNVEVPTRWRSKSKRSEESVLLTVVLPSGVRVLAKYPGVPYHYANDTQAYKKVDELGAKGVKAFVIGHGKPAKYIRIED